VGQGGYRANAGRKRKPAEEKILSGNPGKRPIEVMDFSSGDEITAEPPEELTATELKVYTFVYEWLKKIGCTRGILPFHLVEYAKCKARWTDCEKMNTQHGLLVKNKNGEAEMSPYVQAASLYLKHTNDAWAKIFAVVRETKLQEYAPGSPNDDVMEQILSGKR